jgi:2-iminobutanoate/2-iminopropanoate deaminase
MRTTRRTRTIASATLLLCTGACAGARALEVIGPSGSTRLAPYSPGVRAGDLVFLSGTVGVRAGTRDLVPGGITAETRQALENVRATLRAAGVELHDVVKCTVFLADIRDYDAMNAVYAEFFPTDPPARSAVGVAGLPLGARVEIECLAAARR